MIKVTFKTPQELICFETITKVITNFWFGFKIQEMGYGDLILFSECEKHVQSVKSDNIQSIEHVKPNEL